jgi:hypothetical protein
MYRHSPLMRSLLSQFQTQLLLAESVGFVGPIRDGSPGACRKRFILRHCLPEYSVFAVFPQE